MTDRELLELLVGKVTNIEQDLSSLKTDISAIKEEQTSMKQAISELDTRTTQRLVSDHDTDIRMIKKILTQ